MQFKTKKYIKWSTLFIMLLCSILILYYEFEIKQSAIWVKPESITISCDDYFSVQTEQGVLNNNVWNKHAAKDGSWTQCLEKRIVDGSPQFGWSWSWPSSWPRVIYSQPQIKVGSSPWAPEPKFDRTFPLKISELKKLDVSHYIEISTNGQHNTATTIWLITEPYQGRQPKPAIIAAEIMFWTYATEGHFDPAGRKSGELTVGDSTWEVWHKKNWQDQSGVNDNKWTIVSFRATKSSMKANIPTLELLNYAIDKKLISEELYIADVELGNEIMNGSGLTWVKEFNVLYEKK